MQNLDKILEGLLFLSGDGIDRGTIMEKLQVTPKELDSAVEILKKRYNKDCGITFITYKDKLQLCGNQAYADSVSLVLNPIRERQLTKSTLEVMAIIAYKQPVTRLDVQDIRGINSDYAIQTLLNYKLIEVVGRKDAVGKPLLFGTTDEFLRHFGIDSLEDLPNYKNLLESIKQIENQNNHLYNEFEIPDDETGNKKDEIAEAPDNNLEADKSHPKNEESIATTESAGNLSADKTKTQTKDEDKDRLTMNTTFKTDNGLNNVESQTNKIHDFQENDKIENNPDKTSQTSGDLKESANQQITSQKLSKRAKQTEPNGNLQTPANTIKNFDGDLTFVQDNTIVESTLAEPQDDKSFTKNDSIDSFDGIDWSILQDNPDIEN